MRGPSAAVSLLLTVAVAYYIYIPLPDAMQEKWKVMMADAGFRAIMHVSGVLHWLGVSHYMEMIRGSIDGFSDVMKVVVDSGSFGGAGGGGGGVRVSDTTFDGVPVRVYEPPLGGEGQLKRAVIFYHGGGWALGTAKRGAYDMITRMMSDELNAVVVSVEYRLYPEVHFPDPYLDCLSAAKHLLSPEVLSRYSVDPQRVAVSGDSAGGNLAAAVAQQISVDDSVRVKFSVQALIYPVLQALDFHTPSYQENQAMPILRRTLMVQFWLQYLGADPSLFPVLLSNNHSASPQAGITPELRARVDWTALLPEKHKKDHQAVVVETGSREVTKELPALLDVRASPLLAEPGVLGKCPRAYILTCEFDVLRDDGLMYGRRLQEAGVTVTSDHYNDGFHGCISFSPLYFEVGHRSLRGYINWLQENL